jgi:hypothetical protein
MVASVIAIVAVAASACPPMLSHWTARQDRPLVTVAHADGTLNVAPGETRAPFALRQGEEIRQEALTDDVVGASDPLVTKRNDDDQSALVEPSRDPVDPIADDAPGEQVVVTLSGVPAAQELIRRLDLQRFRENIRMLSSFGDRCRMASCPNSPPDSYENAQNWLASELEALGYEVQRHHFTTDTGARSNLYVTKIGTAHPERMYIVSAHLDGRGGGGAADDNASGCSLVLEVARIFASSDVETDISIRFIWWDQEEQGIAGSAAYVRERRQLRGTPEEPDWLGMIAYDMILYDHGVPPESEQIPGADLDIESRAGTRYADQAAALARSMAAGAPLHADYPAKVNDASTWTDDAPFWGYCPAFSVRANRRSTEIGLIHGQPRIHPYYHTDGDTYEAYSDQDYAFGFSVVKLTAGTLADWTRARIALLDAFSRRGYPSAGSVEIHAQQYGECQ